MTVRIPEEVTRRLEHLYAISKVLTDFESVEQTVPDVIALVVETLSVQSAIFILETLDLPRSIIWSSADESARGLGVAKLHAQTAYGYLVPSGVDLGRDEPSSGGAVPGPQYFVILPLAVGRGTIFGALQIEGARQMDEFDLAFVDAVVGQLAIAVDRQAIIDARQAASAAEEKEQRFLSQVSGTAGSSLVYQEILATSARLVVPTLADLCIIDEVGEDGTLERLEVRFADETKQRDLAERVRRWMPRPGWRTMQGDAAGAGVGRIAEPEAEGSSCDQENAALLRATGVKSMLIVPLVVRGKIFGVLTLCAGGARRPYSPHDLAVAEEVARRVSMAIDNARHYERAENASLAKDNLLSIVSHDLKNQLAACLMSVSGLVESSPENDRRRSRKPLLVVQRAATQMNRLIDDLLQTATIEAGRFSVDQKALALGPLVAELIETLGPLTMQRSLHLVSELPADLPLVYADEGRLHQVLTNLFSNAIKFTPNGGEIVVRATGADSLVTVSVADTGAGIAEDDLPHLFDRFWRAKRTIRLGAGVGLGLFIVKGIIEAHGGTVWADGGTGAGSTFSFTLPVAPPQDLLLPGGAGPLTPPEVTT